MFLNQCSLLIVAFSLFTGFVGSKKMMVSPHALLRSLLLPVFTDTVSNRHNLAVFDFVFSAKQSQTVLMFTFSQLYFVITAWCRGKINFTARKSAAQSLSRFVSTLLKTWVFLVHMKVQRPGFTKQMDAQIPPAQCGRPLWEKEGGVREGKRKGWGEGRDGKAKRRGRGRNLWIF